MTDATDVALEKACIAANSAWNKTGGDFDATIEAAIEAYQAALPKGELAERLVSAEAELRDGPYSSDLIKTVRELMCAAAIALGARVPDGYAVVPKYPTDEMWLAFFSCNAQRGEDGMAEFHYWEGDFGNFAASYHAMLEAADLRADASLLVGGVPEGWRDISTAPKTGEAILINAASTFPSVTLARWRDDTAMPYWDAAHGRWYPDTEVTHWMPLPRPPESGRE